MEYKISYPVYIWFTTALLGALLFFIGSYVMSSNEFNLGHTIAFYFLTVLIGAFISVPALVLLLLALHFLSKMYSSYLKLKMILSIVATVICIGVFLCFGVYFNHHTWTIVTAYIIPLVSSVFFYEVNPKDKDCANRIPNAL